LKGRDMNGFRVSATIGAMLACFALGAIAQGTAATDPKKAPKAAKNADAHKAEPKKAPAKKAEPKKAPAKKAPPKKEDKPQVTRQGGTVQKYQAGNAPALRDSKGNTVQTSPDAYDISSATNPPPRKR
jgi:hypothetical protein